MRLQLGKPFELVEGSGKLDAGLGQEFPHALGRIRDVLDPVKVDLVAGFLG